MKKTYSAIITILVLTIFAGNVFGQHTLVTNAQKKALSNLSAKKVSAYLSNHQKALALAKKYGWLIREKRKDGGVIALQGTNNLGFPVYAKTFDNVISAATTQTNKVQPGGSTGLNLSGSSSFLKYKLGIWDGGAVYTAHQEFAGKSIILETNAAVIDHATHVAGTMIAKGVYPPAKGMAFGASTLVSFDFDNDVGTMSLAASHLLISNHSYGDVAGWDQDSADDWIWYGMPGDSIDYNFGIYNTHAQEYDQIAYTAPYYLIVQSAGNARGYSGPPLGGIYYGYNSRTDHTLRVKIRLPGISSQQSYDGISTAGNAKNALTVGATGPLPFGPATINDPKITFFSSYGPTDDGRVKPDISGMGLDVLSCGASSPQTYIIESGTSMSSPNVTGSLYLLQEYYAKKNGGTFMRAATLKGLACGTAFDAGRPGPDYIYGWGLLDMAKATQAITDNGSKSLVREVVLNQGQVNTGTVTASGNGPLVATISWTDPAGTPTPNGIINDRTIKLVNDLDIRVSDGTTTFKPWILDPLNPSMPAATGDNIRDNIEQVYVANAVPGKKYTITVSHKGALSSGSQPYSIIITGMGGASYCASAPASNADSRINNVILSNINNTPPAGCTTYSDFTNQTVQLERGKTYPLSLTLGTCGNNFNKAAKVYIDWNGDGNFTGAELAATSTVINATGVCSSNITVPLSVIPGNYSLMRVVLNETSDTATIQPCGTYSKGETQDYRVQFLQTSTDAGITAIVNPAATGSCSGTSAITVTVKNFGSKAISNIPVQVNIKAPDNSVTTINETDPDTIPPFAESNYTFNGTFNTTAGATYNITAITNLANDPITANNQFTNSITISNAPTINNLSANYCSGTGHYFLSGSADGTLFWYKDMNSTLPLTFGALTSTGQSPVNNTFYAGLNDFKGNTGPVTKSAFVSGGYNQFSGAVNVHAAAPLIIESARLYIGNSGKITFSVTTPNGQILSSTTINAVATCTNPRPGAQSDDPNDQGKMYNLNLLLPASGDYIITATFDNTSTIFRSNLGVSGYPFSIGNIFSITGNSVSADPDTSYRSYYYYFYDMHVKSAGCIATQRQAVAVSGPVITLKDAFTLTSNFTTGNQWYFNGSKITGATGQTYSPSQSGVYTVVVTFITSCYGISPNYNYVAVPNNIVNNDINLLQYPIPASNTLNVFFTTKTNDEMTMQLINDYGKTVYAIKQNIQAGEFSKAIDVESLKKGVYIFKLVLGQKVYANKIIINK